MRWKIVFAVVLASFGAYASDGVWTNAVGGVWTNADNWTDGTLADGVGAAADFATLRLLRNLEVRDPAARTLGRLVFDDWGGAFSWSVNGWDASGNATGEPLTLSWPSARPEIIVSNTTVYLSKQVAGTEGLLKTGPGALYCLLALTSDIL